MSGARFPRGKFVVVPNGAHRDPRMTKVALRVLSELATYASGPDSLIFPSVATIAGALGLQERVVQKGVACAIACGWLIRLTRTKPGRGMTTNSYRLIFDPAEAGVSKTYTPGGEPGCPNATAGVSKTNSRGVQNVHPIEGDLVELDSEELESHTQRGAGAPGEGVPPGHEYEPRADTVAAFRKSRPDIDDAKFKKRCRAWRRWSAGKKIPPGDIEATWRDFMEDTFPPETHPPKTHRAGVNDSGRRGEAGRADLDAIITDANEKYRREDAKRRAAAKAARERKDREDATYRAGEAHNYSGGQESWGELPADVREAKVEEELRRLRQKRDAANAEAREWLAKQSRPAADGPDMTVDEMLRRLVRVYRTVTPAALEEFAPQYFKTLGSYEGPKLAEAYQKGISKFRAGAAQSFPNPDLFFEQLQSRGSNG